MNNNLLSRVAAFLKQRMRTKRWQRAMTCLAAVVVFGVTYALILPAITMTGQHPTLSAETLTAWTGDELTVKVDAEAEEDGPDQTFVLKAEGKGADLSSSYAFNEEGICVITDEEGKEIELHRSIREDKKDTVDYWFTLQAGTKTSFTLDVIDEVDEARFAELVEAVKKEQEEKEETAETATASDAGKSAALVVSEKTRSASASNADKASASNADVKEANAIAKADEEKIVTEQDDDGFEQILDGAVVNDLDAEDEEFAQTETVASLKLSAGLGKDYDAAVKDAEKNADKRGDAEVKLSWKDVAAVKSAAAVRNELTAYVNGANIAVFYDDEAGIPEGAKLSVAELEKGSEEYRQYLAMTKNVMANATESDASKAVSQARFFDITILDEDGNEIEPEAPVKVVISYDEGLNLKTDADLNVVHFKEDAPQIFKPGTLEKNEQVEGLSFTTDSFSVYAIFGMETLTAQVISAEGQTYTIKVTYGPDAEIPEDAVLDVKEILEGSAEYEAYTGAVKTEFEGAYAGEVKAAEENEAAGTEKKAEITKYTVLGTRLFDVAILSGGEKVDPKAPVKVEITCEKNFEAAQENKVNIVDFKEDLKVAQKIIPETAAGESVTYETSNMSVYAVVWTAEITEPAGTVTFEGDGYTVSVTYTEKAEIPAGTKLTVFEYDKASDEYDQYYEQAMQALDEEEKIAADLVASLGMEYEPEEKEIKDVRSFDFTLEFNGRKIEPKDTVVLDVSFQDKTEIPEGAAMEVVHFAEKGTEVLGSMDMTPDDKGAVKVSCSVDSFSAFTYALTVTGDHLTMSNAPDPEWIVRRGNLNTFTQNLPLGTIHVDAGKLNLSSAESMAARGVTFTTSTEGGGDDFALYTVHGAHGGNGDSYCVCLGPASDWLVHNNEERVFADRSFTLKYPGIATLQDATTADFVVKYSNFRIKNTKGRDFKSEANHHAVTAGVWLSSPESSWVASGWDFDIEIWVEKDGVRQNGETFLFGMTDLDQPSILDGQYYKVTQLGDGTIIGYGPNAQGSGRDYASTISYRSADPKIYLYKDAAGTQPLYWADADQTKTSTTDQGYGLAYAKYVLSNGHLMTVPRNMTEGVTFLEGMQSRVYIPTTNNLYIEGDELEGGRLSSTTNDSAASMNTGYFLLVDAGGFKFKWSGNGHLGTALVSNTYYLRIVSSTDPGGSIGTYDVNYAGQQVPYGFDRRPYLLTSLTVPKGKTQTYEMHPDPNYELSYVVVGKNLNDQEPFPNKDLNPAYELDSSSQLQDYRFPYSLDYVNPSIGAEGKYTLSFTSPVAVTTEHGTIEVSSFEANVGSDGAISSLSINGTPYTKGEGGSWSAGTSMISEHQFLKALYADRHVGRYDYDGGGTAQAPELTQTVCGAELNKIRYTVTQQADGLRTFVNVVEKSRAKWALADGWGNAANATSPWFTEDENGSVRFTFVNVQNNWRIHVHWEKEDPKNLVTIKKIWLDSDNNYHSRPNNLTAYVQYNETAEGQTSTTTLQTGRDANINGGLTWIKDGNEWRYTWEIPLDATVEETGFWEDPLSDYHYLNEENTLTATTDPDTGIVEYVATIKNRWKYLQDFEFDKIDFKDTKGLGGAEFRLYSDKDCRNPLTITEDGVTYTYVARSDAMSGPGSTPTKEEGIVRFNHLYVGTYYMKETVKPDDYDANAMTYCLEVHYPASDTKLYVLKSDGTLYDPSTITGIDDVEVAADNSPKPASQDKRVGALGIKDERYYITNYSPYTYDITLEKQNMSGGTLSGAEFKLYKATVSDATYVDNFTTGDDGKIQILSGSLRSGSTYYLVETKAPKGYILPDAPIGFEFTKTANGPQVRILEGGETFSGVEDPAGSKQYKIVMIVKNTNGVSLPHTGGPGTTLYTLGGMMLLIASALLYGFRRRHEERRSA